MPHDVAINDLVEAIQDAIEIALDEGQPRIAVDLLSILNDLHRKAFIR